MSRKTRKLIWSAPLVAVLAVAGALAIFMSAEPGGVFADPLPAAPTNLMVMPASGDAGRTTLVLTWDAVDGASGYRIDKSDDGFIWETVVGKDSPHGTTSYMDDSLTADDTRWYRVFAVNNHDVGPVSAPNSGTTKIKGMPGPVRNFTATAGGRDQINLTWDPPMDNGGEKITGYEIQYFNTVPADPNWFGLRTDGTAEGSGAATDYLVVVEADRMKNGGYEDKDSTELSLDPGDSRMYRIRALNADTAGTLTDDDRSEDWMIVSGMTQAAGNPGAPTGLTAVNTGATDGEVSLYWFAPENDGGWDISHYVIQVRRHVSGADWKDLPDLPDAGVDAAAGFDTGNIGAEESYNFRIADAGASMTQATLASVPTTYDHDSDSTTPEIEVSWQFRVLSETTDDGDDDAAGGDDVVRRSVGSSEVAAIRAVARPAATDDTLAAPAVSATPDSNATPATVAQKQQINLTINIADTATNVTTQNAYRIDVSEDAGATWKLLVRDTRFTGFGDHREYEHVNLPYDETMHYRVFTVGSDWRRNVGPASALIEGMTAASTAPDKVTGVMASSPDLMTIEASWSAPEETGGQPIVKYQYQYVQDDGDGQPDAGDWAQTDRDAPSVVATTDHAEMMETIELAAAGALEKDAMYHIRVRAVNKAAGSRVDNGTAPNNTEGPWSDAASFNTGEATPPDMVEGLVSQVAMDTNGNVAGVLLLWNEPSDGADVANYVIERKIDDGEWMSPTDDAKTSSVSRTSYTDPRHHVMGEMLMYRVASENAAGMSDWEMVDYPRDPAADHTHNIDPMAMGTIAPVSVMAGMSDAMDMDMYFSDADGDMLTYMAMSDMEMIATASVDGSMLTIAGMMEGTATITVTASDGMGGTDAMQTIMVTVTPAMLTAPTDVTATVDCSVDPGCPLVVTWTPGAGADRHIVALFASDWSLAGAAEGDASGMHTFADVASGTYTAVVIAVDDEDGKVVDFDFDLDVVIVN